MPHRSHLTPATSLADLWLEYSERPGVLAAHQSAAPLLPHHPQRELAQGKSAPHGLQPVAYRESPTWRWTKHVVQIVLVASVVGFVAYGGGAPAIALSHIATSWLLVVVVVVADRQRFFDRDARFEIVEVVEMAAAASPPAPFTGLHEAALVPLARQMEAVLPERVDVT